MQSKTLTISQADEQLASLDAREAQLAAMLALSGTRLAEAEASLGDAFLEGNEGPLREVAELRLHVDGINAALEALSRRRSPAILARRHAEAAELRRKAAAKTSELAELERKTGRLLGELSKLEGVTFTASILSSQPVGNWLTPGYYKVNEHPYLAGRELFQDFGATYGTPRSRSLRSDVADLERQAAAIEQELNTGAAE